MNIILAGIIFAALTIGAFRVTVSQNTTHVTENAPAAPQISSQEPCAISLQSLVNAAAPGSVVSVPPCTYRETVTITKPLTLVAKKGAEIRGSNVWSSGWMRSGKHWIHTGVPHFGRTGECQERTERCHWPEQVFYDGKPLLQVSAAATPTSGQFAVRRDRTLVLADDPNGHTVEVTVREHWVVGGSNSVTIKGFTMKHAANKQQTGGIYSDSFSNWIIEDNVLSDTHGYVVYFDRGDNHRIINNFISRGGEGGIGLSENANVLVQRNRIQENNTEAFDPIWDAGGLKAAVVRRLTMDRNDVYKNHGIGLWCDVVCRDVIYSNNLVHENDVGIFFEMSKGARIFGNKVWNNGSKGDGVGILVSSAQDAEVYDNILAWNFAGVTVSSEDRENPEDNKINGINNFIRNNVTIMQSRKEAYALSWVQAWKGNLFLASANNRGARNKYGYSGIKENPTLLRFSWGGTNYHSLAAFNATLGEEGGEYLTIAEQEKVLSAAGIPSSPPPRP